jgi:outer membrane protein TolC
MKNKSRSSIKNTCLLICCFLLTFPWSATAQDLIKQGEMLTLKRCIEIAIQREPLLLAARSAVAASQSRVRQAKANYYPQITWSSNYSRNAPASSLSRGTYNEYSSNIAVSQNIYDFKKTATQVEIQNLQMDSSRMDIDNVTAQIIYSVKGAYYGLLRAIKNLDVAVETVSQFQQHLDQAKGFFEVGTKPKFDVTKAEVDLTNAKLNLLSAENNVQIAKVGLNNAIGVPEAPDYQIEDNLNLENFDIALDEAMKKAFANRPDLLSLRLQKSSLEKTIELSKKDYYPILSGNAGYGFAGEEFPLERGWNIGTTLTFPLFSGFSTQYKVEEARANLDSKKADEESLKQSIYLDVKQSYLNLQVAKEKIAAADLGVKQARENLELANGRYAAGVGNPIEVTDALVSFNNAKTSYIGALYDYKIAQASIEKAMGIKNETP